MTRVYDLETSVHGEIILNYTFLAGLTLLIHEWVINLPQEIEFIWRPRGWSWMKFLYAVGRYSPFIDTPLNFIFTIPGASIPVCNVAYRIAFMVAVTGIICSECIILIRTYALYDCSRKVLIWLLTLGAGLVTMTYACYGEWMTSWHWKEALVPGLTTCRVETSTGVSFLPFVALTIFEIVVVVMTLKKGLKDFRHARSPVVAQLYVDGVLFFVILLIISVATIAFLTMPFYWSTFPVKMTRSLHSILTCRVLLNLRAAASSAQSPGLNSVLLTGSSTFHGDASLTPSGSSDPHPSAGAGTDARARRPRRPFFRARTVAYGGGGGPAAQLSTIEFAPSPASPMSPTAPSDAEAGHDVFRARGGVHVVGLRADLGPNEGGSPDRERAEEMDADKDKELEMEMDDLAVAVLPFGAPRAPARDVEEWPRDARVPGIDVVDIDVHVRGSASR